MNNELASHIKDVLLKILPLAKVASGGKEVTSRCPFCGGSTSDRRELSFYVSLGGDEKPMMFNCFRASCGAKGILTKEHLSIWGFYDINTYIELSKFNATILSNPKNHKFRDNEVYYLNNVISQPSINNQYKLDYINDRLGSNLSFSDLYNLKISLNISELLKANSIQEVTRDQRIMKELNDSFIGFISQDNAFVTLRNVKEGRTSKYVDKRYIVYNIFNKMDNTKRYYTIPVNINLNNPERIKIHIAEGSFDILSVFINLRKDPIHNIYTAVGGSGIFGVIKFYLEVLKLVNIEFHYYVDNDVPESTINDVITMVRSVYKPIFIHRNMSAGEKDFGVPFNRINEYIK